MIDADLELVLVERFPGDSSIGFVPAYKFQMVRAIQEAPEGQQEELGEIHLRVGDTERLHLYFGHIGYKVVRQHRGHRYASRSIKLLFPLMRSHGMETVWITCDPANLASRRTCELAGAEPIEVVDLPEDTDLYQRGHRLGCRYRLIL